jgi:hypothetical protein
MLETLLEFDFITRKQENKILYGNIYNEDVFSQTGGQQYLAKSHLIPSKIFTYLGWTLNSEDMTIQLTKERYKTYLLVSRKTRRKAYKTGLVTTRQLASVVGELSHWTQKLKSQILRKIVKDISPQAIIITDESSTGKTLTQGFGRWTPQISYPTTSSNRRELIGVHKVVELALPILKEKNWISIKIMTENQTTAYNINQKGISPLFEILGLDCQHIEIISSRQRHLHTWVGH